MPPPFLRKKETVIGIIGQTQGVKIAIKPPRRPRRKIISNERSVLEVRPLSLLEVRPLSLLEYSHISGEVHVLSSQAL